MFWEKGDDIGLSILYNAMSRKEFEALKSFLIILPLIGVTKSLRLEVCNDIMNKNFKQIGFSILFTPLTK